MVKLKFSTVVLITVSLSDLSFNTNAVIAETEKKSAQNTLTGSKEEVVNKVSEKIVEYPSSQYQILNKSNLSKHKLYIAQKRTYFKPIFRSISRSFRAIFTPRPTPSSTPRPTPSSTPSSILSPASFPFTHIKPDTAINKEQIRNQKVTEKTTNRITYTLITGLLANTNKQVICLVVPGDKCILCKDEEDCKKKAQ